MKTVKITNKRIIYVDASHDNDKSTISLCQLPLSKEIGA